MTGENIVAAYLLQILGLLYKQGAGAPGKTPKISPATKENGADVPSRSEAAPTPTSGGRTSAQRGAAQPRPGAPPRERERANPRRGRGKGEPAPPPDEARAQGGGARGRPTAPRRPAPRREGAEQRGETQSGAQGRQSRRKGKPLARRRRDEHPARRGQAPGERPGARERARPPTRAAARGGHGEAGKGRRRNEPHPAESAYILIPRRLSKPEGERGARGAHPRSAPPGAHHETTQCSSAARPPHGERQRAGRRARAAPAAVSARPGQDKLLLDIGTLFRQM